MKQIAGIFIIVLALVVSEIARAAGQQTTQQIGVNIPPEILARANRIIR